MEKLEWRRYVFELFGIECDILADVNAGILLDPGSPNKGYLVQSRGPVTLTVSYGHDSGFEDWLMRMHESEGSEVTVIEEREQIEFCGYPAERIVLKISPPNRAIGHRTDPDGRIENVSGGYEGPFRQIIIGTVHRQTPLTVMFKIPAQTVAEYDNAAGHFFNSFNCRQ